MPLLTCLARQVRGHIRQTGRFLARAGRVRVTSGSGEGVEAVVLDTRDYDVTLEHRVLELLLS